MPTVKLTVAPGGTVPSFNIEPDRQAVDRRTLLRGSMAAAAVPALPVAGETGKRPAGLPPVVAGIPIPQTKLARDSAAFAREAFPEVFFNHCMRTYVFGCLLADRQGVRYDRELAFVASALHDLGMLQKYATPAQPFEVDGADAAQRFLTGKGVSASRIDVVWDAIALHTNGGVARRKRPEIALVSAGSGLDFAGFNYELIPPSTMRDVLSHFPRSGFKQMALGDLLRHLNEKPAAYVLHPFSEVGRRRIPNFPIPAPDDILMNAPFAE